MSTEFTMPSGAVLAITIAPFEDVIALQSSIGKAIGDVILTPGATDAEMSLEGVFSNPAMLSVAVNKIKAIAISPDVRVALFKCFERVTYGGLRLGKDTFDDPERGEAAREDYYNICLKVIEVNCKPFFVKTFSGLKGLGKTTPDNQK